jgi:hypothetical protein
MSPTKQELQITGIPSEVKLGSVRYGSSPNGPRKSLPGQDDDILNPALEELSELKLLFAIATGT